MPDASTTNWARLDAMRDEEIDYTDNPALGDEFFAKAVLWKPGPERQVTVQLDPDVCTFLTTCGQDPQRLINMAVRTYMEAQQRVR